MKKDMTQGNVWRIILLFTLPIMAGNCLQYLYSAVDGIVVGNYVGEAALSAIGTSSAFTFMFIALALGFGLGTGVAVAQYFGAKEYENMRLTISTSMIFMSALGLVLTIIGIITAPFVMKNLLNTPDNIMVMSVTYFRIYCLGLVFQFVYNCAASIMRSLGDSKAMLYFLIISSLLNIFLVLLFVAVFNWGVAGAASATVLSQAVCGIVSYKYMMRKLEEYNIRFIFKKAKCVLVLKLGIPLVGQQLIVALGGMVMQRLINSFGEATIASVTVGNRINQFIFVPSYGFQAGLSAFTAQNIGAGRSDRIKKGLASTLVMTCLFTAAISAVVYVFAVPVIEMFGVESDALAKTVEQIRFLAFWYPLFAFFTAMNGFIQGTGDVGTLSAVAGLSLFTRVITAYMGVYFGMFTYSAAWATIPISWFGGLVVVIPRYLSGKWKKKAVAGALIDELD